MPVPAKHRGLLLGQDISPELRAEKVSQILFIFSKPYKLLHK